MSQGMYESLTDMECVTINNGQTGHISESLLSQGLIG